LFASVDECRLRDARDFFHVIPIEVSGGSNEPLTQLGYVFAKSGQREQAKAIIEKLRLAERKAMFPLTASR